MTDFVRDLIQYSGISDYFPKNPDVFKQLNVEKQFCLPDAKPDIEQITKIIGELIITSTKVIKTPKGISLEGQKVTGWKLVTEGVIKLKAQYVADTAVQPVHGAHVEIPFSTYIVLPENYVPGTPVTAHGFIEDIYSKQMDKRCIFNNVAILLTADFC